MRRVMVRYRVKPDQAERNAELVRAVYEELHRADPTGFRYATFRLDDGVSFVHLAESEGPEDPLGQLDAFREFLNDIAERCDEPPVVTKADEIGSFRFRADLPQTG
jgi:class 3 adenylate cyclase